MESTQPSESEDEGFTVVTKKNLKRKSPKNYNSDGSSDNNNSGKKAAVAELQPVVIQSESAKKLTSFNPIKVDFGLRKAIGSYEYCKPMQNGNIMVKCTNVSQVKTLLNLTELSDASGTKIPVTSSVMPKPGAKGIIRNVPLEIQESEILECLKHQKVRFVKRFQFKSKTLDNSQMQNSTTVLLHFTCSDLLDVVTIGLMTFKTSLYIPRPLRCYKCNRFGHVASKCKNKDRCSQCGGDHPRSSCNHPVKKCVNCGGNHSAADRTCPRYKKEAEIIKIKVTSKISYAEACKRAKKPISVEQTCDKPANPNQDLLNEKTYPFLPNNNGTGTNPISYRPPPHVSVNKETHETNNIETEHMNEVDFSSKFMFGNPIYLIAFLTEVINQTIASKDENKSIDVFQIIADAAGRRMGLPVDINQLKNMIN